MFKKELEWSPLTPLDVVAAHTFLCGKHTHIGNANTSAFNPVSKEWGRDKCVFKSTCIAMDNKWTRMIESWVHSFSEE